MRITLISRSWPSDERSGVSLAAFNHARILVEKGHDLSIIGSFDGLKSLPLPLLDRTVIPSFGSGALYSPVRINRRKLTNAISANTPDLVIVEAWQTALTDTAIEVAFDLNTPVLMISHGISVHPYENTIAQFVRSLAWLPYRYIKLPRLMKKLSAITALDDDSISTRFFDRDLAKRYGIPRLTLKNFPHHQSKLGISRINRRMQILVVGYFSAVKNQMAAIRLLAELPKSISCCFIGERSGPYFLACQKRATQLELKERISFLEDSECDVAEQIANSILVFLPSITEGLPITLIEAMASGTPFVARSVGAVASLDGGIFANDEPNQLQAISSLIDDSQLWQKLSDAGKKKYQSEFTEECIAIQLTQAVKLAHSNSLQPAEVKL